MHFQFLIEDRSGNALIEEVMKKVKDIDDTITYDSKYFKGIGGFAKHNTAKDSKTGKLLNDLATYLRGFNKHFQYYQAVIIIVIDNDDRDTTSFRTQLADIALLNNILIDHVFCIAVEEMEAWLLGDERALISAYPHAKLAVLHSYVQDSICGTWETLADVIYPGGRQKMKKECPSFIEVGKIKYEWSKKIGAYMNLSDNKSPSFCYFIEEINKRISATC